MDAFLGSVFLITLAEIGDKTQLLAIAFASKYKAGKVMAAILIASAMNHFLAVAAGGFLFSVVPENTISLIASLSFIVFGFLILRGDGPENAGTRESKFGPVFTVAAAFFLAEMGDKTQLAVVSLSIEYRDMFMVLLGSVSGMLIASGIGIAGGSVIKKYIPDNAVKWVSAGIFMLFGLLGILSFFGRR